MAGKWRKAGLYLGLVEDEDARYDDNGYDDVDEAPRNRYREREPEASPVRRASVVGAGRGEGHETRGAVALDSTLRAAPAPSIYDDLNRITTLHPRTYNEARTIGEHFRDGTPVIMNLTEMDDGDAKRLVDFAAGLSFGLHGRIERITNKVFLLSPEHVEVTAENKAKIAENGFFNQS
jgi:cell division inhibitor SepF